MLPLVLLSPAVTKADASELRGDRTIFLKERIVINFPLILALVLLATAILWFLAILFEAKEARPSRFREITRRT